MADLIRDKGAWLAEWMTAQGVLLWGIADLRAFDAPRDETGRNFPSAISWVWRMNPEIMTSIQTGPNQAYAEEYAQANEWLTRVAQNLADEIVGRGFRARPLDASVRADGADLQSEFPHKTAARRRASGEYRERERGGRSASKKARSRLSSPIGGFGLLRTMSQQISREST